MFREIIESPLLARKRRFIEGVFNGRCPQGLGLSQASCLQHAQENLHNHGTILPCFAYIFVDSVKYDAYGGSKNMKQWDSKAVCRQLLLLVCSLAIALPSMAGPAFCHDCDCCSSASADNTLTEIKSPCNCCRPPQEEQTSCCSSEEAKTIQASCHCQDTPPTQWPCPLMEKTENVISSMTLGQLSAFSAIPAPTVDAAWYDTKASLPNGPNLLRSVILLI